MNGWVRTIHSGRPQGCWCEQRGNPLDFLESDQLLAGARQATQWMFDAVSNPAAGQLAAGQLFPQPQMKPKVLSSSAVAETRWLRLSTLDYVDQSGRQRKWDMASRTTRPAAGDADAVAILALLRHGSSVETLVVEQFRPPMNCYTLELPAGLIDMGETAPEAALRGACLALTPLAGSAVISPCSCELLSHIAASPESLSRPPPGPRRAA